MSLSFGTTIDVKFVLAPPSTSHCFGTTIDVTLVFCYKVVPKEDCHEPYLFCLFSGGTGTREICLVMFKHNEDGFVLLFQTFMRFP